MREQLYACEPSYLLAYLEQLENATTADIKLSASMFDEHEDDEEDPLDEELSPEGVATIHINGPLSMKGPSPLARLFGLEGTSYTDIIAWFKGCGARAEVKSVVMAFNSPGGTVDGVDLAWQAIAASDKPVTAENDGMCASAAYWLATACPTIRAMSPACMQGSIGVKIAAIDDSADARSSGRKLITIISKESPNKNDDVATSAGRAELQRRADATYGVFRSRVAQGRGMTEAQVQANFGEGALLIASEAKLAGMIDEIRTSMRAEGTPAVPDNFSRKFAQTQGQLVAQATPGRKSMTLAELIASDASAKAEYERALTEAKAAGRAEAQAVAKKVSVYLTSDVYASSKPIRERALKALSGEASVDTVEAAVAMFDLMAEDKRQTAAEGEQKKQPETPGQQTSADADLLAKAATLKIDVADLEARCKAAGMDVLAALKAEISNREMAAADRTRAAV